MNILIIEDSEIEMENLQILLEAFDQYKVIGAADTIKEGIEMANSQQPEVIILDIQLECENSLEYIHELNYSPHIICSTLYTEHALQAFEVGVMDYLTKPITHEKLCRGLNRIPGPDAPSRASTEHTALALRCGTRTQMVPLEQIILIAADRDYTTVSDRNKTEFLSTRRMREWSEILPPKLFATLDRSTIVNLKHIDSHTQLGPDRTATIYFSNGHQLTIGSTAYRRLKSIFSQ
jgi:two-component system response regulator LytT